MKIKLEDVDEIEDDFQQIFLAKSGIHVKPRLHRLKTATKSIAGIKYDDLYIIEPNKFYFLNFDEDLSPFIEEDIKMHYVKTEDIFVTSGLLTSFQMNENRLAIYNASKNIIYIQKGMNIMELIE